MALTHFREGQQ